MTKTYKITTQIAVVLERTWYVEANSENKARELFEEDTLNATFTTEKTINVIGDETIEAVVLHN